MTAFELLSVLLLLVAALGIFNRLYVHLPRTIGVMAGALVLSVITILVDKSVDVVDLRQWWSALVAEADLPHAFLDIFLGFMLFAGTLHVDIAALRSQKWTVLALATLGVLMATAIYGAGIWLVLGGEVPLAWCLTLGALLAPTDPVAVGGLLRDAGLPSEPMALVNGESLFNDGVAVVIFGVLLELANGHTTTLPAVGLELLQEAGGGIILGLAAGYAAYRAMRLVDDSALELTVTLALVTCTYSLSTALHVSGPLAVVVAGLITNAKSAPLAMTDASRRQVIGFWDLTDELLNAMLFLLLGFALLSVDMSPRLFLAAGGGIVLAIVTRLISVSVPATLVHLTKLPKLNSIAVLTWGGLRGGISIALALTMEASPYRGTLLAICYAVVIFTILVQGLTMPMLVRWLYRPREAVR